MSDGVDTSCGSFSEQPSGRDRISGADGGGGPDAEASRLDCDLNSNLNLDTINDEFSPSAKTSPKAFVENGVTMTESNGQTVDTQDASNITSQEAEEESGITTEEDKYIGMSKNQIRKLKKKEKWLGYKMEKRAKERARKKQRRREAIEQNKDVGQSRKRLKKNTMTDSSCQIQVVIDCSFDHLMNEKDINSLVQQIQYCYSANRRAENPLQFHVASVVDKTKARLDAIQDSKGWDIHFHAKKCEEIFDDIVYLSSESDNMLETLEPGKAYVIGGLVDHNHHKGLCHQLAEEKGLSHAQLPIGQYLGLKTRKVLAVNHVYEILLNFTESGDWEEAFCKVIPKRKGLINKTKTEDIVDNAEEALQASAENICDKTEDTHIAQENTDSAS